MILRDNRDGRSRTGWQEAWDEKSELLTLSWGLSIQQTQRPRGWGWLLSHGGDGLGGQSGPSGLVGLIWRITTESVATLTHHLLPSVDIRKNHG